jgi:hypothetical protein
MRILASNIPTRAIKKNITALDAEKKKVLKICFLLRERLA